MSKVFLVGNRDWSISEILQVAKSRAEVQFTEDPHFQERIHSGAKKLSNLWKNAEGVYGVTTGFGNSWSVTVPPELRQDLSLQLVRYHGCGLGDYFSSEISRAVVIIRALTLARGYSGVRLEVISQLLHLINRDIVPCIPQEGSVGASGDLTPLSYVAAVLMGEREVWYSGERMPAREALARAGLEPIQLGPKEGLALMNGTSVMTAIACSAYARAEYLSQLAARITAMAVIALKGNRTHFSDELFLLKPFPGQRQVAQWISSDLGREEQEGSRLQDRYSLRCAPHVIGVLSDALPWMKRTIETEMNSVTDNPIIDPENGEVLHGGHFYGGHIAFAMDSMKNAVANIADLLDRQLALLVDSNTNHGLPVNLSGARAARAAINHGFKAVQIAASAWTAEALKLSMPASVFSRSTESHNQDKVSMGTIAARDCLRVLELSEQVAAAMLLACAQAIALRERSGELSSVMLNESIRETLSHIGKIYQFLEEDRALEGELRQVLEKVRSQDWGLYST